MKRLDRAPFALASDGTLLLNVAAELSLAELQRLLKNPDVFVGLPLEKAETRSLKDCIADAGEESAARLLASRRKHKLRQAPRRRAR